MLLSRIRQCWLAACLLMALGAMSAPALAAVAVPGTTARIDVEPGNRVNVRGDAAVRPGNIVGKASSGDLVVIREADDQGRYVWYRVEDESGRYDGWVRGDFLAIIEDDTPAPIDPSLLEKSGPADPAAIEQAALEDEPVPLDQRSDWSRILFRNFDAISACAGVSSAQPSIVLRAFPMSRGMIDVIVRDARSRDWDCIVAESGGTPMRFDPLAGTALGRTSENQPYFTPLAGIMPTDDDCLTTETVNHPDTGTQLGWLTYDQCE